MRSARTISEAATTLNVSRSSIHRWIADGDASRPSRQEAVADAIGLAESKGHDDWAAAMRRRYLFEPHEEKILALAEQALVIAQDHLQRPSVRLQAMSQFTKMLRALDLPTAPDKGTHGTTETDDQHTETGRWPRRA